MIKVGDILPIFVSSSMKLVPLPNGEFTNADDVGSEPPTIACGKAGAELAYSGEFRGYMKEEQG